MGTNKMSFKDFTNQLTIKEKEGYAPYSKIKDIYFKDKFLFTDLREAGLGYGMPASAIKKAGYTKKELQSRYSQNLKDAYEKIITEPEPSILDMIEVTPETLIGGKADNKTVKDIAEKWNVSLEFAQEQLDKGIAVEMEHTNDKEKATEISKDHLYGESINYYIELEKMEKKLDLLKRMEESDKRMTEKYGDKWIGTEDRNNFMKKYDAIKSGANFQENDITQDLIKGVGSQIAVLQRNEAKFDNEKRQSKKEQKGLPAMEKQLSEKSVLNQETDLLGEPNTRLFYTLDFYLKKYLPNIEGILTEIDIRQHLQNRNSVKHLKFYIDASDYDNRLYNSETFKKIKDTKYFNSRNEALEFWENNKEKVGKELTNFFNEANKNFFIDGVKYYLDNTDGLTYKDFISEGRMTVKDAITIIESAGLTVPDDIKNMETQETKIVSESETTLNKVLLRTEKIRGEEVKIYTVNGTYIRDTENIDFTMGGHHYVSDKYSFIPDGEIYIDQDLNEKDREATILHELTEYELMKYKGLDYETAHDKSSNVETELREGMSEIKTKDKPKKYFNNEYYQLLGRLKADCDYIIQNQDKGVTTRHLWAGKGNVKGQIDKMKELWNSFPENMKPQWLTMGDILEYERKLQLINNNTQQTNELKQDSLISDEKELDLSENAITINSNDYDLNAIKELCEKADKENKTIIADVADDLVEYYQNLGFEI